jgi:hypothetical protein
MRKVIVVCLALTLFTVLGLAQADKLQEREIPPDFGNDYQVGMAAPGATQVLEDFEAGVPPANWNVTDNVGSGVTWNTNVFWNAPNKTSGSGIAAACDSDEAGIMPFDTELITESYDFCAGSASGLNAAIWYEQFSGADTFEIDVSTDGGANWTNILSWFEDHFQEDISLDLSAFDGYPSVMLRFHYFDTASSAWDWDVQVDNFELTSDGTIVPGTGTCSGPGGDGGAVPATSTTGIIILAVLLMIGGSLFVVLRRRTA